jgi:hypothetical protein
MRAQIAFAVLITLVAAFSDQCNNMQNFKYVPENQLFVSEPDPTWFGNSDNPKPTPAHWTNSNWLKSRFHFSFAEWRSGPSNFGVLRVLNDDLVQVHFFSAFPPLCVLVSSHCDFLHNIR